MAQGIARSAGLFYLPKVESLAGSKLYFYQTGTSTPVAVYTNFGLTVAHTQPVVADSSGRFDPIYIDGATGDLRVSHYTSADVLIYQVDNYPASLGTTASVDINQADNPIIQLVQSGAASNNKVWYIQAESQQLKMSLVNDSFSAETDFLTVSRSSNTCTNVNLSASSVTVSNDEIARGDTAYVSSIVSRNTTTTLTADAELVLALRGSAHYLIEGELYFYASTTAGMGIKFDLNYSGTIGTARNGLAPYYVNGAGGVVQMAGFPTTPISFGTISTNVLATDSCRFSYSVDTTTAGNMSLRWAQNTSNGSNLNLMDKSWIRATRMP